MIETFNLYLSAAADLTGERDLFSRVVTELPVTLGWKISFTPLGNKPVDEEAIQEAHFHLVILGEDIRAPVGFEWLVSRRTRHAPVFFVKDKIPRTMAASDFLKRITSSTKWSTFSSLAEFRHLVLKQIGQHLLDQAEYFSIKSPEYENLSAFLQDLEKVEPESIDRVTGEDSVILTRERFIPKDGVLIESPGDLPDQE